ncbi:hypothetical protein EV178_005917 [Coemansia sp. RSA 1646]|nr:hypothetical protein EV178_005917 [Coemansia sp. RSA 1646]KAJ2086309.1 hypothetical protein IW138_005774 [Coemansia sp. RSA 986]KAJ2210804.1 hypothetical protein EV179_005981 [Coemansia sp. RSA 487]
MSPKKNQKSGARTPPEAVIQELAKSFSGLLVNFSDTLTDRMCVKFDISPQEAEEIAVKTLEEFSVKTQGRRQAPQTTSDGRKCDFELLRGPRKGGICGKPALNGCAFCSVHKRSMAKRGVLAPDSKTGSRDSLKFVPYIDGMFLVEGTDFVVGRKELTEEFGIDNCEVVGVIENGIIQPPDESSKKFADANNIPLTQA